MQCATCGGSAGHLPGCSKLISKNQRRNLRRKKARTAKTQGPTAPETAIKLDQNLACAWYAGLSSWLAKNGFTLARSAAQQKLRRAPDRNFNDITRDEVVITRDHDWLLAEETGNVEDKKARIVLEVETDTNGKLKATQWAELIIDLLENINLSAYDGSRWIAKKSSSSKWVLAKPTAFELARARERAQEKKQKAEKKLQGKE